MDPAALISIVAAGSGVAGYILKRVVDHLLGRRTLRVDEATKLRNELRADLDRKDLEITELKAENSKEIRGLKDRLSSLEGELEKAERERDALDRQLERYKLDVYRTLISYGADKDLVDVVLAIPIPGGTR